MSSIARHPKCVCEHMYTCMIAYTCTDIFLLGRWYRVGFHCMARVDLDLGLCTEVSQMCDLEEVT